MRRSILAIAVLAALSSPALARSDEGEAAFALGEVHVLPAPDLAKIRLEDEKAQGGPYRYGVAIPVEGMRLGEPGFGRWSREKGMAVWRFELVSPGARTLDFHFSRLELPLGAELRIIGEGKGNERRITARDLSGASFYSPYIAGERALLELRVPQSLRHAVALELGAVMHGYRGLFESAEPIQKSGACNVDVACPAGDGWRDQIDSVGHYTFTKNGSGYVCTGTLIANTQRTTRPLFLTANHCISSNSVANTVVVYWNYQSSTCRTPGSSASGTPLSRSIASHSQSGATLRANNAASDFALLELNTAVPTAANPFWSGWDRSGATPSSAVGIHHPSGHEKRISVENHPLTVASYLGATGSGTTHWRVADWDQGTTEGGSSGSGLWDPNKRLIGQLHGGYAACGNDDPDWYGRLSVSWTGGGSSSTRLSDWLDPIGSGVQFLDGYRASSPPPDTTPPTTPSGLSASASGSSAIALSWSASTDSGGSGLAGYRIERCAGAGCTGFAQIATVSGTSYSDSGLSAGTTYRYRIRAYDNAGNVSAYSAIAEATTASSAPSLFQNTADYAIRDFSTTTSPITVSGRSGNAPSNLRVNVDIKHTYIGDLRVRLLAPNGTAWTLHNRTGGGTRNLIRSYTVNASSVPANGTWRLEVYDAARGDTGYIDAWSLQF